MPQRGLGGGGLLACSVGSHVTLNFHRLDDIMSQSSQTSLKSLSQEFWGWKPEPLPANINLPWLRCCRSAAAVVQRASALIARLPVDYLKPTPWLDFDKCP